MLKILIADDQGIMRQGLRSLVENQSGMTVVGEAEDGQTAVRLAGELLPDVTVMDVTMPGLNGVEATRQIVQRNPNMKVIILSMHLTDGWCAKRSKPERWPMCSSVILLTNCAGPWKPSPATATI